MIQLQMNQSNIDSLIYKAAIRNGYSSKAALFVVAQARLETADYSSNVFKNNNNLFGMKFINQRLATRGTLAPLSERTCNGNCNTDYYAKYSSVTDSVNDLLTRLYNITRNGITPDQLKNSTDTLDFSTKLKQRNYYGTSINVYNNGLISKLKKINLESLKDNSILIFIPLIFAGAYFLMKR